MKIKTKTKKQNIILPLVILWNCTSFSQDAKDALSTSVSFLLVPGVNGGIWEGTSVRREKSNLKFSYIFSIN